MYVKEISIQFSPIDFINGKSYSANAKFNLSRTPDYPRNLNTSILNKNSDLNPLNAKHSNVKQLNIQQTTTTLPNPDQNCYSGLGCVEWYMVSNTNKFDPSTGVGQIPIGMINVDSHSYGIFSMAFSSQNSIDYNLGLDLSYSGVSSTTGLEVGGSLWSTSATFTKHINVGSIYQTNAYVYVNAQLEGAEYQYCYSTPYSFTCMNDYMYIAGIVNVQVSNGEVQGGAVYGNPYSSYLSGLESAYSYQSYNLYSGTGSNPGSPYYTVQASQLIQTWFSSLESGSIGIDIGALLSGVGAAVPLALSLTISSSASTVNIDDVQFDANLNYNANFNVLVSINSFTSSTGGTGYIPFFGVQITTTYVTPSSGGNGCVNNGTPILLANGSYEMVQNLKIGDQVAGYNFSSNSLQNIALTNLTSTSTSELLNINSGLLELTPTDQPIYMTNSSYTGWIINPKDLKVGDFIFNPVNNSWIKITSLRDMHGHFTVFDVVTSPLNNFVGNGILLDLKPSPI